MMEENFKSSKGTNFQLKKSELKNFSIIEENEDENLSVASKHQISVFKNYQTPSKVKLEEERAEQKPLFPNISRLKSKQISENNNNILRKTEIIPGRRMAFFDVDEEDYINEGIFDELTENNLLEVEKRQRQRDRQKVVDMIERIGLKEEPSEVVGIELNYDYLLFLCCFRFKHFKKAYLFILVNDIILSANVTLYTFVSTFQILYYIMPLIFSIFSNITYLTWRVRKERFDTINKVYWWFRIGILILFNIPYSLLIIRLIIFISKKRNLKVEEVSENLEGTEKLILSMISLNNIYFLVIVCLLSLIYTIINLVWCCVMRNILKDAFEYQELKSKMKNGDNGKKSDHNNVDEKIENKENERGEMSHRPSERNGLIERRRKNQKAQSTEMLPPFKSDIARNGSLEIAVNDDYERPIIILKEDSHNEGVEVQDLEVGLKIRELETKKVQSQIFLEDD